MAMPKQSGKAIRKTKKPEAMSLFRVFVPSEDLGVKIFMLLLKVFRLSRTLDCSL